MSDLYKNGNGLALSKKRNSKFTYKFFLLFEAKFIELPFWGLVVIYVSGNKRVRSHLYTQSQP